MILLPVLAPPRPAFDSAAVEVRVNALLRRMTLEEKIGQLVQFSNGSATGPEGARVDQNTLIAKGGMGSILNATGAASTNALQRTAVERSRLKIPLIFGLDVIHGYRTIYPVPLAMAASWDTGLIERTARMAAVEATAEGVRWTFSPMVDIARDARWGRILEGAGEDVWLGERVAAAYVRGYQGKDLADPTSMLACVKHYAAYGGAEAGRDYNTVDMSDRVLRQTYLPPYRAAIDAGAATVMSSFNTLQGIPASGNRWLMTDVLRGEWGFKGFVVSDWGSITEMIPHGVALDAGDAAAKGLNAGVDMDMAGNAYASRLVGLVKSGRVKAKDVEEAARRVLRIKVAMGLFERPYTDEARAAKALLAPDHVALAREAAEASFVLLKNEGGVLPLKGGQKVALIGPLADSAADMLGGWAAKGEAKDAVTLRAALSARLKEGLSYAKGTDVLGESEDGFIEAVGAAQKADVVVMALGENRNMSGEAHSRTNLGLPGNQLALLKTIAATGKPIVLVLFSGRPLALPWEAMHVPAILEAWFPGVQAGPALERTLFGEASPSGRLTASFPRSVGQEPLYYDGLSTGRPVRDPNVPTRGYLSGYLDEANSPLFPFGHGLTYTTFEYSAPKILASRVRVKDRIEVVATVRNTGSRGGVETVQLYVNERGTSVARPVRELKGYQSVALAPGESRTVRFTLTPDDLAFWNAAMKRAPEPCELTVWVAPNAGSGSSAKIRIEP